MIRNSRVKVEQTKREISRNGAELNRVVFTHFLNHKSTLLSTCNFFQNTLKKVATVARRERIRKDAKVPSRETLSRGLKAMAISRGKKSKNVSDLSGPIQDVTWPIYREV